MAGDGLLYKVLEERDALKAENERLRDALILHRVCACNSCLDRIDEALTPTPEPAVQHVGDVTCKHELASPNPQRIMEGFCWKCGADMNQEEVNDA